MCSEKAEKNQRLKVPSVNQKRIYQSIVTLKKGNLHGLEIALTTPILIFIVCSPF